MRIKLLMLACLFASAQFLGAEAIATCAYGYPVTVERQAAYGDTEAQVDCQFASASVSFSLVGSGGLYADVASLSIHGDFHVDSGAYASLRLPLVVVGGPPQGLLEIYGGLNLDLFSFASFGYAWMQVGDWFGQGLGHIGYTRGQPIDLWIGASAGSCPSCAGGGVGGYRASVGITGIAILNASGDHLAEMAHLEVAPEPGCLWLGAAGLCALGVLRRHRDPGGARNWRLR